LLSKTVSRHCKVVLGGDGGDELFGGYVSYQALLRRDKIQRNLPRRARSAAAAAARRLLPVGLRGRNSIMALGGSAADGIAQSALWTDEADLDHVSCLLARRLRIQSPKMWRRDLVDAARGLPGAAMVADFKSYLPEDILVKVDRASMLSSLEVRAPFLDRRVIEFAYERVPNRFRVTPRERKILLKSLARRLLPASLDIDRKQGFTIPISKWLSPEMLATWIEDCREEIRLVLSESVAGRLIKGRSKPAAQHSLYAAIMLTTWMRHYRVSV
jgi:asparagine synthase (glutamine-hydrolysing)